MITTEIAANCESRHGDDGLYHLAWEVDAWIVPLDLLDAAAVAARSRIGHLDLEREKARYGAHTLGGVGISHAGAAMP